jgi:hypothetical protein
MQTGWIAATVLLSLASSPASGQPAIRLKSGRSVTVSSEQTEFRAGGHLLVQFREPPGPAEQAELERRGIRVLRYVPDSAFLISSDDPPDLSGLDIVWSGRLLAGDKISPVLRDRTGNAFVAVFHADVGEQRARELAEAKGFDVLEGPSLLRGQLLVTGAGESLPALAELDEMAYIIPASFELAAGESLFACPGALTENGLVGEFAVIGKGWSRDSSGTAWLQYFLTSIPTRLTESAVRGEIERAMREWERYGNVRFGAGDRADAVRTVAIRFARGAHGDGYPFDGAGKVLAHTFYPAPPNAEPAAGDMHFDADEYWSVGAYLDLYSVALHELGHSLGLGHSDQPGAVMYPYYRFTTGLATDDIAGIRSLYGTAGTPPAADPPVPKPADPQTPSTPAAPPSTPSSDKIVPSISITSPGSSIVSIYAATIRLSGAAADNVGVVAVKWSTSSGASGTATGVSSWKAEIPLLVGTNTVTVRAYDAAGNSGWRTVMVVRR